jgi:LysR family glycine cleavage system transcriptional activator
MRSHRIPSLNWLRVFETAARLESFARAAEVLNMSPPAVSQQIKALEGYLGKPLFVRGPHHVTLTDEARAFLPSIQLALSSLETTAVSLFGSTEGERLTLRVLYLMAASWLPPRLRDFESRHPGIRLQINCGNARVDFHGRDDDLHIAFGSPSDFPATAVRLFGEELYPIATPEIARTIKQPHDLLNHRLIEVAEHRSGWFQVLQQTLNADVSEADIMFADTTIIAMSLAAADCGLALARAPVSDPLMRLHGLVACLPELKVTGLQHYYLYTPAPTPAKPAATAFTNWLLQQIP